MSLFGKRSDENTQRSLLGLIDGMDEEWGGIALETVKRKAREYVRSNKGEVDSSTKEGLSLEKMFYLLVSNISQEQIESTEYHVYRGVLDAMGNDMLRIFNQSIDCLIQIAALTAPEGAADKRKMREMIKKWG